MEIAIADQGKLDFIDLNKNRMVLKMLFFIGGN